MARIKAGARSQGGSRNTTTVTSGYTTAHTVELVKQKVMTRHSPCLASFTMLSTLILSNIHGSTGTVLGAFHFTTALPEDKLTYLSPISIHYPVIRTPRVPAPVCFTSLLQDVMLNPAVHAPSIAQLNSLTEVGSVWILLPLQRKFVYKHCYARRMYQRITTSLESF